MATLDLSGTIDQFRNLNTRDVSTWPIAPRIAALVAIVVLVLLAGWYFEWSDQLEELDRGSAEEAQLKVQYKDKLQQAINLEPLKKQKELAAQYVARLEKQLPSKAEMDALLSDISQAGVGRGLQFDLFRPGQVVARDYYAELPISIRLVGTYHDIAAFTSDVASLPRIVTLNNVSIAAAANTSTPLVFETVAKTFRYLDPEEVAAQRKAPKGAAK